MGKVETADGEGYISTEFASVADMYQYAEKPQVSEQKESSSGGSVTSYALQFLGNPYVWGGTSLTKVWIVPDLLCRYMHIMEFPFHILLLHCVESVVE